LEKLNETNASIKIINNNINAGFPKAVNQGISISKGEYIVLLNNDAVVTSGWLDRMISVAESDNTYGMVGPISNSVSWNQIDKEAKYDSLEDMKRYASSIKEKNRNQIEEFPRIAFLCVLIKQEVIQKIGGLDERFTPGNYEDDDYCLRAQIAGFKTVIAKDVFVHHFGSKSFTQEGNDKYLELLGLNKTKFIKKWGADPVQIWLKGAKVEKQQIMYPIEGNKFLEHFHKATKFISDENFAAAGVNFKIAIENYNLKNENSIIGYNTVINLAGNVALINADYSLARKYFEEELKLNPDSSTACAGLAEVFYCEENYESAKIMFEWAVKNDPGNISARTRLEKLEKSFSSNETIQANSAGNQSDPLLQADNFLKEARQNFENKKFEKALSLVGQAEYLINEGSLNGQNREISVSINNFKGYSFLALHKQDEAKKCFEQALVIFPSSSDACAGLGESFFIEEKLEESKTMYEWAVKNDSENIFAVEGLKKVNMKLGYEEKHNSLLVLG
jgi:GT2 family glycosyltransferase/Flp pilus assembly protein TadD